MNWRVKLSGVDITGYVSGVQTRWEADNICGECEVALASRAPLAGMVVPRVPQVLSIAVEEYKDGAWLSRGEYFLEQIEYPQDLDAKTATIWGRSASARLTTPWAQKISKQWTAATTIADIIAEMAALCGVTVTVTDSFPVCQNCYVASDQYPSEIIRDLAEKSGQIVWPQVDGSLLVAPRAYTYGDPGVTLDASVVVIDSVTHTAPEFGNRILIDAGSVASNASVTVIPQYPESGCVEANGEDSVQLVAVVTDDEGAPVTSGTVAWAASSGMLAATETTLGEATIIGEEVQASSFVSVRLAMAATRVLGVYAYSDRSRRTNLYTWRQGSVSGDTITFAQALDYYDQSLRVDYVVDGAATNAWIAGRTNADVVVTAVAAGASGTLTLYQGQAAECPSTITMEAHPPSDGACMGIAVPITVTVIRDGRAAGTGMATFSIQGSGSLSSTSRALSTTEISEYVQAYTVGSESQVQLRAIPAGSVTVTDGDGPNIAGTIDRDVVVLTTPVAEGTRLLATYRGGGAAITAWIPPRAEGRIGDVEDVSAEVSVYIADGSERGLRASVSVSARDCRELPPVDPEAEDPDVIPVTIDPCDASTWPTFDPEDPTTWPVGWAGVDTADPTTYPLAFDYCNTATWPTGFDPANSATWPTWMGAGFNPLLRATWPTHAFDPTKPSSWPSFDPYDKSTWPASVPQTSNFGDPSTWPEGYDPCNPETWPDTGPCDPFDPSTLPETWTGTEDPCDYTTWPEECGADFNPTDPDTWPDDWTADSGDPDTWPDDGRDPDYGDDPTDDDNSWPDSDGGSGDDGEQEEPLEPDPTSCLAEQIVNRTPAYAGDWAAVAGVSNADNCPGTCTCDQICDAMRSAGKLGTQFYSQCVAGCTTARSQKCDPCELSGPDVLAPGATGVWTDGKTNSGEVVGALAPGAVRDFNTGYTLTMPTGGAGPFTVKVCYGGGESQCCETTVDYPACYLTGPSELAPGAEAEYKPSLGMAGATITGTMEEVRKTSDAFIMRHKPNTCSGWLSVSYGGQLCGMMTVGSTLSSDSMAATGPATMEPGESGYFAVATTSGNYDGLTLADAGGMIVVQHAGQGWILRMPDGATGSKTMTWTASCGRSASATVGVGVDYGCENCEPWSAVSVNGTGSGAAPFEVGSRFLLVRDGYNTQANHILSVDSTLRGSPACSGQPDGAWFVSGALVIRCTGLTAGNSQWAQHGQYCACAT